MTELGRAAAHKGATLDNVTTNLRREFDDFLNDVQRFLGVVSDFHAEVNEDGMPRKLGARPQTASGLSKPAQDKPEMGRQCQGNRVELPSNEIQDLLSRGSSHLECVLRRGFQILKCIAN